MKVAVIGSRGQLGSDLVKVFGGETVIPLAHEDIEVTDYGSCAKLSTLSPDVVINTAAFHKTDACEDDPLKAFSVNAVGSKNVSQICREIGAVYIYISTDYVFDGTKGEPYTEGDVVNPINTYRISK
ncbi:MAG: sugar nucleotide-binding protein, partial [Candidatus Jordarchaeaceae archaeon]